MSSDRSPATHVAMPDPPDETIAACLARRALQAPDTAYCEFRGRRISLSDLDAGARRWAARLHAQGLRRGQRVALMWPTDPEHLFILFALARLGAVRIPVNLHLRGAPLVHLFDQLEPQALIADPSCRPVLGALVERVPLCLWRDTPALDRDLDNDASSPAAASHPDDLLALALSSGTTGAPKGVHKSDRHLRAGAQAILQLTGAGPGDTFLFWESLHHGSGVAVAIAALLGVFKLAMVERFSASQFWREARECGATHVHYLGGVVAMLMKQPPGDDDRRHAVRIAWGGGCPAHLAAAFAERFGVQVREGYGLTELLTFVTLNPDGPPGSIGKPLSHYDIALCDESGDPVPDGSAGEIVVRSRVPGLQFLGYFRSPEADAACRRGDWFLTGDLATRDASGWLYYGGRRKEMLRRRGINISAWEVEQVFAAHPDIEEVALVGVPGELGDDELKLFVRLREGRTADPLALVRWAEPQLAYFQVPRYLAFIDEFPKTPTQRIQKKELSRGTDGVWDLDTSGHRLSR